jgi:hypothetical protein
MAEENSQGQQNTQGIGASLNSFSKGLNQDLAKTIYKEGNYLDALNITLLTDNGLSTAVVQNKKGTKLQIQFPATIPAATYETNGEYPQVVPAQENLKVIEGIAITEGDNTERLFFFTKSNTVGNLNDNGYGQIWRCSFLGTTDNISGAINGYELTVNGHMMYNRDLNFKNVQRIKAIGKYENQNFSRIYWTDGGFNPVRSINTVGALTTVIQTPVRSLNIVAESNLNSPVVKRLIKGGLPEGKYQLAYRLLSKHGDLTNFSTCSNLIDVIEGYEFNSEFDYPISDTIDITTDVLAATDTKEVMDSQKGIEFYIPSIDKDYQMIQYVLIYYSQPDLPEIYMYPYKEISLYTNQNESFTDLYSDTSLLTTEEFNIMYSPFEKARTIEVKDNILFAANTTNDMFKVNVDYRAYRYNSAGQATTYELDGTTNTFNTNYPNNNLLDVINPYNDESGTVFGLISGNTTNWFYNQQYKFQQNGTILGGQGPNISYTFGTTSMVMDHQAQLVSNKPPFIKTQPDSSNLLIGVPNHVTNNNGSFSSLKSPYKSSCQVSWQRGEVYRFGITFYNKKGQASYVNWVGDIKMPDFNEVANNPASLLSSYNDATGALTMFSTYIDFSVNIPQDLAEEISGFRIVYVERQENDKTRFGTGITGGLNEFKRFDISTVTIPAYIINIIVTVFCHIVDQFLDDIGGPQDVFNIKENIKGRVITNLALALYRKLYTLDVPINKLTNINDLADFVETVLDGAVNRGDSGSSFGGKALIKVLFAKTIDRIKETVKDKFRKTLAKKVAGIHENVLSLGQRGFSESFFTTGQGTGNIGYVISPTVDFNKYTFKQGDYLKPINMFEKNGKIINEIHRDTSVGLYNILDASAYLKKWYRGKTINWNRVADSDLRRIYIKTEKVLQPGELLGTGIDSLFTGSTGSSGSEIGFVFSNSYISSIPQANQLGQIMQSDETPDNITEYLNAARDKYNEAQPPTGPYPMPAVLNSFTSDIIQQLTRPHMTLGIGDKKHFIVTDSTFGGINDNTEAIPVTPWDDRFPNPIHFPDWELYGDNESYLRKLFYGNSTNSVTDENKETIRKIDYNGDYTVSYNREISINQYGGVGYSSRANNEYIPASEFYSFTTRVGDRTYTIKANLGDTYLGVYDAVDYAYYYNQVRPAGYQEPIRTKKGMYHIFPCEASFNFTLREGEHPIISLSLDDLNEYSDFKIDAEPVTKKSNIFKIVKGVAKVVRYYSIYATGGLSLLATKTNVNKRMINDGPDTAKNVLRTARFLLSEFKYNDVFHQKYNIQKYFPPSMFFDNEVDQYTNRIWHSKPKIDGEVIDSWRDFQFVDYIDVEGTQGPIVEIVVNKNKIFFYQTNGIGIASSNERGALQGSDGSIVLSNNKVLLRYDYITKETGTSHQYGVINTNNAVYHYDGSLKKIFKIGEGLECISDNLGLFSKLQSVNNNINKSFNGIHGVYDTEYQTVYFTFLDPVNSENSFTLGYNEKLQAFESFYSFKPKIYFKLNTRVFSSLSDDKCYWHNKGDYGSFYGTTYPSKIKLLTNEAPLTTKVWDIQKFQTQVYDSAGVLLNNDTFDFIQHKTENQDTGLITLIPQSNIIKKERDWKLIVDRDINNATFSTLSKPRLRDMYLETEITFTNESNKRFILHPITTFFRQSIH